MSNGRRSKKKRNSPKVGKPSLGGRLNPARRAPSKSELHTLLAAHQSGDFESAEAQASSVTKRFPKHPFAWKILAAIFKHRGALEQAREANSTVIELSPNDPEAHNNLATTLLALGKYKLCEESALKALQLKSDFPEPLNTLGVAYQALGKLETAKVCFIQSIELRPSFALARNNLGELLLGLNELQGAEQLFRSVVALEPLNAAAHSNLAKALDRLGLLDQAIASYKQALTLQPNLLEIKNELGIILEAVGHVPEAESTFIEILQDNESNLEARINLGNLYLKAGEPEKAKQHHAIATNQYPHEAAAHNALGITFQALGAPREAEASYRTAIELDPKFADAIMNRHHLYFEEKNYLSALADADCCDTTISRACALDTLFALGSTSEIYERIKTNMQVDRYNLRVASFASFIAHLQKQETANNFCPNPLAFLHVSHLSNQINSFEDFIEKTISELNLLETIWEPEGVATERGHQTPTRVNLFSQTTPSLQKLKELILNELDIYYEKFSSASCDFINSWPKDKYIHGWQVVLKQQGHQKTHIHPAGWMSGVIYLQVVPNNEGDEGAIAFSLNGERYSDPSISETIHHPDPGDILLFPSSLHHRTIPFTCDKDRIIISFDLIPSHPS
jgi:Flp pilus assembly protein TadD